MSPVVMDYNWKYWCELMVFKIDRQIDVDVNAYACLCCVWECVGIYSQLQP